MPMKTRQRPTRNSLAPTSDARSAKGFGDLDEAVDVGLSAPRLLSLLMAPPDAAAPPADGAPGQPPAALAAPTGSEALDRASEQGVAEGVAEAPAVAGSGPADPGGDGAGPQAATEEGVAAAAEGSDEVESETTGGPAPWWAVTSMSWVDEAEPAEDLTAVGERQQRGALDAEARRRALGESGGDPAGDAELAARQDELEGLREEKEARASSGRGGRRDTAASPGRGGGGGGAGRGGGGGRGAGAPKGPSAPAQGPAAPTATTAPTPQDPAASTAELTAATGALEATTARLTAATSALGSAREAQAVAEARLGEARSSLQNATAALAGVATPGPEAPEEERSAAAGAAAAARARVSAAEGEVGAAEGELGAAAAQVGACEGELGAAMSAQSAAQAQVADLQARLAAVGPVDAAAATDPATAATAPPTDPAVPADPAAPVSQDPAPETVTPDQTATMMQPDGLLAGVSTSPDPTAPIAPGSSLLPTALLDLSWITAPTNESLVPVLDPSLLRASVVSDTSPTGSPELVVPTSPVTSAPVTSSDTPKAASPLQTMTPERRIALEKSLVLFQDGTNTPLVSPDLTKTRDAMRNLRGKDEVDAFIELYNQKYCPPGSGRTPMTAESLDQTLSKSMLPSDYAEARVRSSTNDPVEIAAVEMRNSSGDPTLWEEGYQQRLKNAPFTSGFDVWKNPVERTTDALTRRNDGDRMIETIERLTPEQRQKLAAEHPEVLEQAREALKGQPAKRELLELELNAPEKADDPTFRAKVVSARLLDCTVFGGKQDPSELLTELETDPELAKQVLARYNADRERLRGNQGEHSDPFEQLKADVADRAYERQLGNGIEVASPDSEAIRGREHATQLDSMKQGIARQQVEQKLGTSIRGVRDALEDPVLGPQMREDLAKLGVDPKSVVEMDDQARQTEGRVRAQKLMRAANDGTIGGPDGLLTNVVDPAEARRRDVLTEKLATQTGADREATQREIDRLDARQESIRRVMDETVAKSGMGTDVENLLQTRGDGLPDLLRVGGKDPYSTAAEAWRNKKIAPEDLLLTALPPALTLGNLDMSVVRIALEGKSPAEVQKILADFRKKYGSVYTLYPNSLLEAGGNEISDREFLMKALGEEATGTDKPEFLRLLHGDPSRIYDPKAPPADPEERARLASQRFDAEQALRQEEDALVRTGSMAEKVVDTVEDVGEGTTGRQSTGKNTQLASGAVKEFMEKNADKLREGDPAKWAELEALKVGASGARNANLQTTADVASTAASAVKFAGALVVAIGTGGSGTPLAMALWGIGVSGVGLGVEYTLSDGGMSSRDLGNKWREILIESGVGLLGSKLKEVMPALEKLHGMDEEALKAAALTMSDPEAMQKGPLGPLVDKLGRAAVEKLVNAKIESAMREKWKLSPTDELSPEQRLVLTGMKTRSPSEVVIEGAKTLANSRKSAPTEADPVPSPDVEKKPRRTRSKSKKK